MDVQGVTGGRFSDRSAEPTAFARHARSASHTALLDLSATHFFETAPRVGAGAARVCGPSASWLHGGPTARGSTHPPAHHGRVQRICHCHPRCAGAPHAGAVDDDFNHYNAASVTPCVPRRSV